MATFCYTTDDGQTVEDHYPCGQAPKQITLPDGRMAVRDFAAEISGMRSMTAGAWPRKSTSMAVHPSQIREAMADDRSVGVPTEYSERGEPIFTSQGHQDRWVKAHKVHDFEGGYGSN